MKVTVYWLTRDREAVRRIREKFAMPCYTTVNGETEAEIDPEQMPLLLECERLKFITIRKKKTT